MDKLKTLPPVEIINLAAEMLSEHNDGWSKERAREKLTDIRDYIDGVLGCHCISCGKTLVVPQHLDYVETKDGKYCLYCIERGNHIDNDGS